MMNFNIWKWSIGFKIRAFRFSGKSDEVEVIVAYSLKEQ